MSTPKFNEKKNLLTPVYNKGFQENIFKFFLQKMAPDKKNYSSSRNQNRFLFYIVIFTKFFYFVIRIYCK